MIGHDDSAFKLPGAFPSTSDAPKCRRYPQARVAHPRLSWIRPPGDDFDAADIVSCSSAAAMSASAIAFPARLQQRPERSRLDVIVSSPDGINDQFRRVQRHESRLEADLVRGVCGSDIPSLVIRNAFFHSAPTAAKCALPSHTTAAFGSPLAGSVHERCKCTLFRKELHAE